MDFDFFRSEIREASFPKLQIIPGDSLFGWQAKRCITRGLLRPQDRAMGAKYLTNPTPKDLQEIYTYPSHTERYVWFLECSTEVFDSLPDLSEDNIHLCLVNPTTCKTSSYTIDCSKIHGHKLDHWIRSEAIRQGFRVSAEDVTQLRETNKLDVLYNDIYKMSFLRSINKTSIEQVSSDWQDGSLGISSALYRKRMDLLYKVLKSISDSSGVRSALLHLIKTLIEVTVWHDSVDRSTETPPAFLAKKVPRDKATQWIGSLSDLLRYHTRSPYLLLMACKIVQ